MAKDRVDQKVVALGLAESREKAQRLIMAGHIRVNGRTETRPSHQVSELEIITLVDPEPFVSRGGEKMEAAFQAFQPDVRGCVCLDVGASTGGFTDCLLQHGAARVYAVDVGKGQLHWKLRNDPRVVVMEKVNARYLKAEMFPVRPRFAVMDVSFISLTKVLPAVQQVLERPAEIIALIKPQFEAGREQVGRGGVIKDPAVHKAVIDHIRSFAEGELGLCFIGLIPSPVKGPAGNVEYLIYWKVP